MATGMRQRQPERLLLGLGALLNLAASALACGPASNRPAAPAESSQPAVPIEGDEPAQAEEEASDEAEDELAILRERVASANVPEASFGPELLLIERGPRLPFWVVVLNRTQATYALQADPRLLSLELEAAEGKPERCAPPPTAVPKTATAQSSVELAPGDGLLLPIDPRALCFRPGGTPLKPGTLVQARFGWPTVKQLRWVKGKREEFTPPQKPPFVATRLAKDEAEAGTLRELQSSSVALSGDYAEWLGPEGSAEGEPLAFILRSGSDAATERQVMVEIGLKNTSQAAQRVFLRREFITFEVSSSRAVTTCAPSPDDRAPEPAAFTTLKPGQEVTLSSRMVELCPRDTFAEPGLYVVTGKLELSPPGSAPEGMVRGTFAGKGQVLVRVGHQKSPDKFQPFSLTTGGQARRGAAPADEAPDED